MRAAAAGALPLLPPPPPVRHFCVTPPSVRSLGHWGRERRRRPLQVSPNSRQFRYEIATFWWVLHLQECWPGPKSLRNGPEAAHGEHRSREITGSELGLRGLPDLCGSATPQRGQPRKFGQRGDWNRGRELEDGLTHAVHRGRRVGPPVEKVLQLQLQIDVARDAMLEWGTPLEFSCKN